jgi:imidazolonepropionase-like amidohydrolase
MGYHRELEASIESMKKMHKRGIRILPGGDYGFAWIEHGTNAKDLEYFVKYLGFTPMEALLSATHLGGQIMMKPNDLGCLKDGYLADMLLIDGDPLADITILQDQTRILSVMKDGRFYKEPHVRSARTQYSRTAA